MKIFKTYLQNVKNVLLWNSDEQKGLLVKNRGASFNGRTTDSDSVNVGSIPTAPAKNLY